MDPTATVLEMLRLVLAVQTDKTRHTREEALEKYNQFMAWREKGGFDPQLSGHALMLELSNYI